MRPRKSLAVRLAAGAGQPGDGVMPRKPTDQENQEVADDLARRICGLVSSFAEEPPAMAKAREDLAVRLKRMIDRREAK